MLLPIVLFVGWLLTMQIRFEQSDILAQSMALAEKSAAETDGQLLNMQNITVSTAADNRVLRLMRSDMNRLSKIQIANLYDVQKLLSTIMNVNPLMENLLLYFEDSQFVVTHDSGSHYQTELEGFYATAMIDVMIELYAKQDGWYSLKDGLYYKQGFVDCNNKRGAALSFTRKSTLAQALNGALPLSTAYFVLFDSERNIVAESSGFKMQTQGLSSQNGLYEQKGIYYSVSWIPSTIDGYRYALMMRQEEFTAMRGRMMGATIGGVIFALVMGIGLAYYLAVISCRPFEKILKLLETPVMISKEAYEKDYQKYDELGMIYTLIHQSKYQYLAMQDELSRREDLLRRAQNAALQAQMNPHFLYNTLESINWMAIEQISEDNQISSMVTRLARLLRTSVQTDRLFISVREEIEHARLYIELQQMRFHGLFSVEWRIDPLVYSYATIRLSLQPLIENSIKHGVRDLEHGHILISCKKEENYIVFEVEDNGKGIEEDKLARLKEKLNHADVEAAQGIGLTNLALRMKLLFGTDYGLELFSQPYQKTLFRMKIPLIDQSMADQEETFCYQEEEKDEALDSI